LLGELGGGGGCGLGCGGGIGGSGGGIGGFGTPFARGTEIKAAKPKDLFIRTSSQPILRVGRAFLSNVSRILLLVRLSAVQPSSWRPQPRRWVEEVKKHFSGQMLVAKDLMEF